MGLKWISISANLWPITTCSLNQACVLLSTKGCSSIQIMLPHQRASQNPWPPPTPINDDEEIIDNGNLLKLAVQEKYDSQDVVLLSRMEISIPMKNKDIKHHVKSLTGLSGRCFSQSSVIHNRLKKAAAHIEPRNTSYNYELILVVISGSDQLENAQILRFMSSSPNNFTVTTYYAISI